MATGSGYRSGVMVSPAPDHRSGWPPSTAQVEAARAGDNGHLTGIMAAGIPKLVAFYRGMGMKLPDAEDLASDTCEALVRSFNKLRDPTRFEPWFWRIARSKFYDHLRRNRRPDQATDREEMYDNPSDTVVIADEHRAVREAFLTLKLRDRELLWMRDVSDLAYTDIAGRFSMSEGAIRIAVMRARQRLEVALEHLEDESRR